MAERIVINTGPLITLARMNALSLPAQLPYEFICPQEVRDELDEGEAHGYDRIQPEWLAVDLLTGNLPKLETSTLGKGEAAVIALALEQDIKRVCIDEWKGRRAALTTGLKVTGVLGLLGRAKKLGIIDELRPFVEQALAAGIRYDDCLVRDVLRSVGE